MPQFHSDYFTFDKDCGKSFFFTMVEQEINNAYVFFYKTDLVESRQNLWVSGENRSGRTRKITKKFTEEGRPKSFGGV
jgi:hypothetical protein